MSVPEPPRPLEMLAVAEVSPPRAGDVLLSLSVSPQRELVCGWASGQDHARLCGRAPSGSPQTLLPPPGATLRVTVHDSARPKSGRPELRELREVTPANPSVHLLPGGETLVVGARAAWRGGDPQHNAVVYGADGRAARSACLGDGVNRVATTACGQVWVGYFDEGVFGNFGWGGGGAAPIGAPGWNRFDRELQLAWSHPEPEEGEIADCYAMTITDETCAVCPYTDWPILSADLAGGFRRAKNSVGGAHELLVDPYGTALIGGYGEERARVVMGLELNGQLHLSPLRGELRLAGQPWRGGGFMTSRDGALHALVEGTWATLAAPQIAEALEVERALASVQWGKRRPRGR